MPSESSTGRCPMCKAAVNVEARFKHGDQTQCGNCGMLLKVLRTGGVRLVIADVGRVREELQGVQQRMRNTQSDLARAKASFGIGANGFGIGVIYVIAKFALEEIPLDRQLITEGVGIALLVGILLEAANYLFLAKRKEMSRLRAELKEDTDHARHLQARLREAR